MSGERAPAVKVVFAWEGESLGSSGIACLRLPKTPAARLDDRRAQLILKKSPSFLPGMGDFRSVQQASGFAVDLIPPEPDRWLRLIPGVGVVAFPLAVDF